MTSFIYLFWRVPDNWGPSDLNSIARLKISTFWPILKTFTYDLWCGWQGVHLKKMLDILLCTYFSAPAGTRKTVHIGEEFQFSVRHRNIIDCSSLYIALCLHSCSSSVDLLRFRCWSCDPRPRTRTPLPRLGGGAGLWGQYPASAKSRSQCLVLNIQG